MCAEQTLLFDPQQDHAACGIGITVQENADHALVQEALRKQSGLEYRSGFNPTTGESDGAGIRFYGLSTHFFGQFVTDGTTLDPDRFAIGQYFFPKEEHEHGAIKKAIEATLQAQGLRVAGWRSMDTNTKPSVLSPKTLEKKPALIQAIIVPESDMQGDLELNVLRAAAYVLKERPHKDFDIVSQSSESIVYKGMVPPSQFKDFFLDLCDEQFTARAIQIHTRFATNTSPQWKNAQPCAFFIAHNGELNSRLSNARQMLASGGALPPDLRLSDSIQFDVDLLNQILDGKSLDEAFTLLMPPTISDDDPCHSQDVKDMLKYFALKRTGYNGPAFMVASHKGEFVARLDSVGLRPSRYVIIRQANGKQKLHAYSDDDIPPLQEGETRVASGNLEPGGFLKMKRDGTICHTSDVLEAVCDESHKRFIEHQQGLGEVTYDSFSTYLATNLRPLGDLPTFSTDPIPSSTSTLSHTQKLETCWWDYEAVKDILEPMALEGKERVGAMGDDTSILPAYGSVFSKVGHPLHLSYCFHQLFSQVSSPPLDSIKERSSFSLRVHLGDRSSDAKHITLPSPILPPDGIATLERNLCTPSVVLDMVFSVSECEPTVSIQHAITRLCKEAERHARDIDEHGNPKPHRPILILSDRCISQDRAAIPDVLAVAAVKKHLAAKGLSDKVSIVCDSQQVVGPHQAALLLAMGAEAVCPTGAYRKIEHLCQHSSRFTSGNTSIYLKNYRSAMDDSLLKIMGKMGITDVNNYINGNLVAALGLDLSTGADDAIEDTPSLANIFRGTHSPLKGFTLDDIVRVVVERHRSAVLDEHAIDLHRLGHFKPESNGIKHGFGPEVVNAFKDWMNAERIRDVKWQLFQALDAKGKGQDFIRSSDYSREKGFISSNFKTRQGYYPDHYLNSFMLSPFFKKYSDRVETYRHTYPTSIYDLFTVRVANPILPDMSQVQTQKDIRGRLFSGSMSQGALTVADPDKMESIRAHESIVRGANAVHANSSAGEGGENIVQLQDPDGLRTARSKQVASGRFGVSVAQIKHAKEIEIKVAQGAKPGEGGQLPGFKVSIRFASQRGSLPGVPLISPPPHHDIYSIEDLEQLIHDIKTVNKEVNVSVKLVASEGIGTIACGVVKAGADRINIASNSGGTGAALQTSIKHAGLPSEVGLAEVDQALRLAGLRDLVKLKTSAGFKTGHDVIKAAILGADLFEFGTISMMTVGCVMQRTCNKSCEPGVAKDGEKFKGNQLDTERFFLNIAAEVQSLLRDYGFTSLDEIRGQTDLLTLLYPELDQKFDFRPLLYRPTNHKTPECVFAERTRALERREDQIISRIHQELSCNTSFDSDASYPLCGQDRSFGSRISGSFYERLETLLAGEQTKRAKKNSFITIRTNGSAGQSYGFVLCPGMKLEHTGPVQDGAGKSMSGGKLIVKTPIYYGDTYQAGEHTIAGNAALYGASGGKAFINGRAGHRFGILLKGANAVVEGVGDYACEYMTSGTVLVLGPTGKGFGAGASGGIAFVYDPDNHFTSCASQDVEYKSLTEATPYESAIRDLLQSHRRHTQSRKARVILDNFHKEFSHFKLVVPKALANIKTLPQLADVFQTYSLRATPISIGMRVWLGETTKSALRATFTSLDTAQDLSEIRTGFERFAREYRAISTKNPDTFLEGCTETISTLCRDVRSRLADRERVLVAEAASLERDSTLIHRRKSNASRQSSALGTPSSTTIVTSRVSSITGTLDKEFVDIMKSISRYIRQLTKDAEGCSGCRSQSCSGAGVATGCPDEKPIQSLNEILQDVGTIIPGHIRDKQWSTLLAAFRLQAEKTPFFGFTGAACPAPCEDACTESEPDAGAVDVKRGGKKRGDPVPIKDIELLLYKLGRKMGWFEAQTKIWSHEEVGNIFGQGTHFFTYYQDHILPEHTPVFSRPVNQSDQTVVIVGSGPAAMQIAYEALKDGKKVRMYEKSDKPGGLLMDGIPAHKYDKEMVGWYFDQLKTMGLELHLNSEVIFEPVDQVFKVGQDIIARGNDDAYQIALCLGAGAPKTFPRGIVQQGAEDRMIQAADFLKVANDIAAAINPGMTEEDINHIANDHFAHGFPGKDFRGKRVTVVGGGDTAQDATRWMIRYLKRQEGDLNILVRGPQTSANRSITRNYPFTSDASTGENALRDEEIDYIGAHRYLLTAPTSISLSGDHLKVDVRHSRFKDYDIIEGDSHLKALYDLLPRQEKPIEPLSDSTLETDYVIMALGFEGPDSIGMLRQVKESSLENVFVAGDAANSQPWIIVGAQRSASDTYQHKMRSEADIARAKGPIERTSTVETASSMAV